MPRGRYIDLLLSLLRLGLGLFFLVTAVLKIDQLGDTAEFLTRSRLLPAFCSLPLACIGVAMELVVALCLLLRRSYRGASLWAAVMCTVYLLLYAQAWARGLELSCNCLGAAHEIVNYPLDTGLRLLLLAAVTLLLWDARRPSNARRGQRFDFSQADE
ncbi:MAG: MauE/DoxX family redox-associated membrane protein [Akkermansia sp.]